MGAAAEGVRVGGAPWRRGGGLGAAARAPELLFEDDSFFHVPDDFITNLTPSPSAAVVMRGGGPGVMTGGAAGAARRASVRRTEAKRLTGRLCPPRPTAPLPIARFAWGRLRLREGQLDRLQRLGPGY